MSRVPALATVLILALGCGTAVSAAQKPSNDDCLVCHGDSSLSRVVDGRRVSLFVDPDKFSKSMHGGMFSCVDCHTDIKEASHTVTPAKVSCGTCHTDQQAAYEHSFHAQPAPGTNHPRAACVDCHGSPHDLLPAGDPQSRVNHANIPSTCGTCHSQRAGSPTSAGGTQPFAAYEDSVHGRALAKGIQNAAVCTDCHGAHEILTARDPASKVFKFNVPDTCGQCHGTIEAEFKESIHGQAIARGQWPAPVCTDCHGIHSIRAHTDPRSSVYAQNLAENTCARCHEGVGLAQEFGFEGKRVSTYLASYHGLALQGGSTVVANCASCHGVHNILPSSDPRSSVNRVNLVKTCGQCHRGVTEQFVAATVHVNAPLSGDAGSVVVRWVRRFYLSMIFLVVGGMLAHNGILWGFKAVARKKQKSETVVRMSRSQRFQHTVLFVSFFVLVLTGFALKFPDSWLKDLMLGMSEHMRGWVHRIAGVVLIGSGLYHLYYVALQQEGRKMLRDFLPEMRDVRDCWLNLQYQLGWSSQKPAFGRFTYAEKVEYWALVWGTVIMAVTGIMLWAKVAVGNMLPRWWLDVATAIHFYEAVLASLAIVVWHFYQVFFDPDTYPMNWAWWDGQAPVEHYRAEHPLDLATIVEAGHAPADAPETKEAGRQETERTDKKAEPEELESED